MQTAKLRQLAHVLEWLAAGLAGIALLYRMLIYGHLPPPPNMPWGMGDVIDFAFAAAVFLAGLACAGCAVALSARVTDRERGAAWRSAAVGMTAFVVYYLLHPLVPVLSPGP